MVCRDYIIQSQTMPKLHTLKLLCVMCMWATVCDWLIRAQTGTENKVAHGYRPQVLYNYLVDMAQRAIVCSSILCWCFRCSKFWNGPEWSRPWAKLSNRTRQMLATPIRHANGNNVCRYNKTASGWHALQSYLCLLQNTMEKKTCIVCTSSNLDLTYRCCV